MAAVAPAAARSCLPLAVRPAALGRPLVAVPTPAPRLLLVLVLLALLAVVGAVAPEILLAPPATGL